MGSRLSSLSLCSPERQGTSQKSHSLLRSLDPAGVHCFCPRFQMHLTTRTAGQPHAWLCNPGDLGPRLAVSATVHSSSHRGSMHTFLPYRMHPNSSPEAMTPGSVQSLDQLQEQASLSVPPHSWGKLPGLPIANIPLGGRNDEEQGRSCPVGTRASTGLWVFPAGRLTNPGQPPPWDILPRPPPSTKAKPLLSDKV